MVNKGYRSGKFGDITTKDVCIYDAWLPPTTSEQLLALEVWVNDGYLERHD